MKHWFVFFMIGFAAVSYAGQVTGSHRETEMDFIVIGDIHYFGRHARTQERMRALCGDLKNKGITPDLICQLGDVIENQSGSSPVSGEEGARQWREALKDIKTVFPDTPVLICTGNHDWYGNHSWFGGKENLQRYLIPFLEKELDSSLNGQLFYSFRFRDSLFLFTNHVGMDSGMDLEQRKWLTKNLMAADANPAVRHVWAFGHCGLWNVNYFRFNENAELLPLFAESRKLKAYFTGHVHQNNISVRKEPGKHPVLQAVAAGFSPDNEGIPQKERFLTLNPPPSFRGYTAFPESCPSYCRVTVNNGKIRIRYEKIGGETIAEIIYEDPGRIQDAGKTEQSVSHTLPSEAKGLKLHLYPYFPERFLKQKETPEVIFNGYSAGKVPRNSATWHVNHFRYTLELPPGLLKKVNTIEFTNPNRESFLIRDCQLEAIDRQGVSHFSELYPMVISAGDHRNIYMNFGLIHPEYGILHSSLEYNAPDEIIRDFPLEAPIKIQLKYQ